MTNEKKFIPIVDIVKAAACIMIFLYHCNTILPAGWKFLTVLGQDMGNNLFFMVSGFALAPSIRKTPGNEFLSWYKRRLIRILPITFLAYFGAFLMGFYSLTSLSQLVTVFIYPTLYWFVSAILIYYILLFIIGKITKGREQILIAGFIFILFAIFSERQEKLYLIGLLAMLSGFILREKIDEIDFNAKEIPKFFSSRFLIFGISLMAFIIGKPGNIRYFSSILTDIGVIGVGSSLLMIGYGKNKTLSEFFTENKAASAVIKYIGGMALPIYLVQCFCSGYIGYMISLLIPFPRSFLVNFVVIWGIGTVLYYISRFCTKKFSA
ncbi:acyltransferase family protein [Lachnospiraceae bacterium C1.1]|nr:acyltransferase family protein [Lachnospiraceae bacterium C1.1]